MIHFCLCFTFEKKWLIESVRKKEKKKERKWEEGVMWDR
jgi:hypothetical protein